MDALNEKPDEITLILSYDSQTVKTLKCNKNDKLENVFKKYASNIGVVFNNLFFLYAGNEINDYTQTFSQLITSLDKETKEMNILIYNKSISLMDQKNYITIIFSLNSKDIDIEKVSRNTILKNICKEYALKKGLNLKSLLFKYGEKEINLNLKFDEMASSYDKNCMGITILVYNKNPLKIKFHFKNEQPYIMDRYKEDKIKDIFNEYALNNSLDINNLSFKYGIILDEIDQQQTFNQLINNYDQNSDMGLLSNATNSYFNETKYDNISEIDIFVEEKEFQKEPQTQSQSQTSFKKYKKIIIIISIIIILIIIALICVFLLFKKKKSDSQNSDTKAKNDIKESSDMIKSNSDIILTDSDIKESSDIIKVKSDIIITDNDIKTNSYIIITDSNIKESSDKIKTNSDIIKTNSDITMTESDIKESSDIIKTNSDIAITESDIKENSDIIKTNSDILITESDIKESSDIIKTNSDIIITDNYIKTSSHINSSSDIIIIDSDIKTDKVIPKSCGKGYYIPDDDKSLQDCQKCSLEGCEKCNGTYEINECTSCGNLKSIYYNIKIIKCNYTCETGNEDKCLTCDTDKDECINCNNGYKLVNGKCKPDYLIKATYLSVSPNEQVNIVASHSYTYITRMIIDGKNITPIYKYNFPEKGYHTVYIKFKAIVESPTLERIFTGIERLMAVTFSNFDDYIPLIKFNSMFNKCTNLTSVDLSKISFDMKKKYDLSYMFKDCINLKYVNLNFKKFNVNTEVANMFYNCKSLISIDLSKLNMANTKNFENMFYNCNSLKSINFAGVYLPSAEKISYMFYNCISLKSLDISSFKPNQLTTMTSIFMNCISLSYINLTDLYTHSVKSLENMFYNCSSLKSINVSHFNTQNVQSLKSIFSFCSSLESIDVSNFDTNKVTDMSSMFYGCYSLTSINLKNIITDKVTNMSYLFASCYSLTTIDLSNFNTEKVYYFEAMFARCYSLKSINILHFNTKNFINLKYMFFGCYSLTSIDLSNFNRSYTHNYNYIFNDCPNLSYVNIAPFFYHTNDNNLFNKNISSNGTLILNEDYYKSIKSRNYIPSNWTLIFIK